MKAALTMTRAANQTQGDSNVFTMPANSRLRLSFEVSLFSLCIVISLYIGLNIAHASLIVMLLRIGMFAVVLFLTLDLLIFIPRRIRYTRVTIDDCTVAVEEGKMFHRSTVIPTNRVTLIHRHDSPVTRYFGQTGLQLVATTTELTLPYMSKEDCERIVAVVASESNKAEEDAYETQ
ncbi:MAG: PH domain-containing protein [Bifidobacterium tibiigranuli]|jgi:membrane protein YdbS with pleckstrin-like domain|nr:PH domain-containing protein [Bifidobacterium tibiigranuli]